ncbi:hypothetical protein SH668x_001201 [Planctomicrobium sp. SH668]|uniref:hypothetical protein n=1 Tax=Planctomicrobium sp. SH668 TaxID=3448126 RepID=UPI003F5C3F0A
MATTEFKLHESIASVLRNEGIEFRQEVVFGKDRPDFLCNGEIVIEVKIQGGVSDLIEQVYRYSKIEQVKGIVVVTTKPNHRIEAEEMNEKPVRVYLLSGLI